ncbi:MAG: DUF1456 family protein [Pseudomonadota bacterium]|nr:DUF1456 family protein [Pseudomonadota bacterium]
MNYNDVLRRLRFLLDLDDALVIEMFARAGDTVTPDELTAFLLKDGQPGFVALPSDRLERFLDTLILDRRGPRTSPDRGDSSASTPTPLTHNDVLKKLRIALDLKEEDVLAAIEQGDGTVTRPHLRCLFRNAGHKHYRECDDELLHAFLNGLTRKARKRD